jgi:ribosome-associated protein
MRASSRRQAKALPAVDSKEKALRAMAALVDKRAVEPMLLDMREITLITDYFLICSGTSNVHIRALGEAAVEALEEMGLRPHGVEGREEARWVLLDYGDLIVHVFAQEEREFYALERLWGDAARVAEAAGAG